jgi:hypothetical protein
LYNLKIKSSLTPFIHLFPPFIPHLFHHLLPPFICHLFHDVERGIDQMIEIDPVQAASLITKMLALPESRTLDFKRVADKMVGKAKLIILFEKQFEANGCWQNKFRSGVKRSRYGIADCF